MCDDINEGIIDVLMRVENAILFLKMNPDYPGSLEGEGKDISGDPQMLLLPLSAALAPQPLAKID